MRLKSRTALVLVSVSVALTPAGSAGARPVRDVGAPSAVPVLAALPPVVQPRVAAAIHDPAADGARPRTSPGGGGIDTPALLLLGGGVLLAGAALGFGGARVHATRGALHSH